MKRMRISKQNTLSWLYKNFGIGGIENYDPRQVDEILSALRIILQNCGLIELEFLGKFLLKLSEDPTLVDKLLDELSF